MIDIILLRIMKYREDFEKLGRTLPEKALDPTTYAILQAFGKYFDKFKDHDKIDIQVFLPRLKQWYPTMPEEYAVRC